MLLSFSTIVAANEGDAYRLASLPIGQLVHGIPKYPGDWGRFCRAAGTSGKSAHLGNWYMVSLSIQEIGVDSVGQQAPQVNLPIWATGTWYP